MKVLVVRMSSMGDVLHTLPALSDAVRARPALRFDWVVEEAFTEIPAWHPAVDRVIPVALRRWRKHPLETLFGEEWRNFRRHIRTCAYDRIIDAQGLMKSAFIACLARGRRCGPERAAAREALAALAYHERCPLDPGAHAVQRVRRLFAHALSYTFHDDTPDYGIAGTRFARTRPARSWVVFVHGTTWPSKLWPEPYWIELARLVTQAGYQVRLPWDAPEEQARAQRIAAACEGVTVLPRQSLTMLAEELGAARGVVAVDSGPGHLAAALERPAVSIYGATDARRTGTTGVAQAHLVADFPCSPCLRRGCNYRGPATVTPACYGTVTPQQVWDTLQEQMNAAP